MDLNQLIKSWIHEPVARCILSGIKNDSRLVEPGDLFIAYPGAESDGRLFMQKAVDSGAVAILFEPNNLSCQLPKNIPCIPIPNLAMKLAELAQAFYSNPSASFTVTGITGTNGKTTIAYQLAQAHELLGQKSAYVGTIGQGQVHHLVPLSNTTPDALCLQQLMAQYRDQQVQQVCMEVSSHALHQHRVDKIAFDQALFTNLTLDHLDYHKTMQAYGQAKALLFAKESLQWAISNKDDAYQQSMNQVVKPHVKKLTYGLSQGCDVKAEKWTINMQGTEIEVRSPWGAHRLQIKALGQFNIYNSLAIFSSLMASGYEAKDVVHVMSLLQSAPGRMEIVAHSPYVLVDYAHTPDALENVLTTLSQLKKGQLWVVFGCGGDRDKSKRPIMGKAASLYADRLIITSDNPRTEDPEQIIDDISKGISTSIKTTRLVNREEAIAFALNSAAKEDIILIAGKGHEAYQQIGTQKFAFSDQDVVRKLVV